MNGKDTPTHPASVKNKIGYVSFELHQNLMAQDRFQEDLREYAGKEDEITRAKDVILSGLNGGDGDECASQHKMMEIADRMGIGALTERNITHLSTGEMRKTLIARALMKSPRVLILDEPFDGLDTGSRESLSESVNALMEGDTRVILITHRLEEIPSSITHVLLVKDCRLYGRGSKTEMLTSDHISGLYGCPIRVEENDGAYCMLSATSPKENKLGNRKEKSAKQRSNEAVIEMPVIEMKDVTVRFGDTDLLKRLDWSMRKGENWAVLGHNGAGKSTIARLILGDNPQCYSNDVRIFGRRKGSGETVWEIKKRIGFVSSDLQVNYRKSMSANEVIASGFYDSIGLYRFMTAEQKEVVDRWVEKLGIEDIARRRFDRLSYGQRRMILLARSVVKSPELLIMDEPCHGLDIPNRLEVMRAIDAVGETETSLIYITNQWDEMPDCITHVMVLERGEAVRMGPKEEVLTKDNAIVAGR